MKNKSDVMLSQSILLFLLYMLHSLLIISTSSAFIIQAKQRKRFVQSTIIRHESYTIDSILPYDNKQYESVSKIKHSSTTATKSLKRSTIILSLSTSENLDNDTNNQQQIQQESQLNETTITKNKRRRVSLLACPAQFCVPDDYIVLFDTIKEQLLQLSENTNIHTIELGTCVVCPLPRTEWIKVAKQLPTQNFIQGILNVQETLDWYFTAIEAAATTIVTTETNIGYSFTTSNNKDSINNIENSICIIGHSIGGWVARAYLGGMSCSSSAISKILLQSCTSLITLGTPHINSNTALVDQTRGLITAIDITPSCSSHYITDTLGITITCICSNGIPASIFPFNIEQLIAIGSYVLLAGLSMLQWNANNNKDNESTSTDTDTINTGTGDGIVPIQLAFLSKPSTSIIIKKCLVTNDIVRHSHVLPTPWNIINGYQSSILLPYPSYVSPGVVSQWIQYIQ